MESELSSKQAEIRTMKKDLEEAEQSMAREQVPCITYLCIDVYCIYLSRTRRTRAAWLSRLATLAILRRLEKPLVLTL